MPKLYVYQPGAHEPEIRDLEKLPQGYDQIKAIVEPILKQRLEHVSVLWQGKRADMFVGDESALDDLPVNRLATEIYHAAGKQRGANMAGAPVIYGPAVVFDQIVWR